MQLLVASILLFGILLGLATLYLLILLAAAVVGRLRRTPRPAGGQPLRFCILVPAHDEEAGIGATLDSLSRLEYAPDRFEVMVIADNCGDRTAALAGAGGATVWERVDPARRGKGHALAWALERLAVERTAVEAVAFVDADCHPSTNMLLAMDRRLRTGAPAVQVNDVVANHDESWSTSLRFAAFALMNYVRPLGQDTLGLSCGLRGTGMAFRREVLERHPWQAFSVAEDCEYHARLVLAGERVAFAHEASVRSAMPATLRQSRTQHERYESGKWQLVHRWAPRLLRDGLRRADPVRFSAGVEALMPPQALLFASNVALVLAAVALWSLPLLTVAALNLLGQVVYVLGGLALAGAPAMVYRALVMAPVLAAWKVWMYLGIIANRGPRVWVRAPR